MLLINKALAAGALVAVLLLLASATTPAGTLSFRNSLGTRTWGASWSEFGFGAERNVLCSLTLSGSIHANTIVKTRSTLVGHVTSGSVGSCGVLVAATVLTANLPWHVRYQSFSGSLPNIASLNLQIVGFEYRIREAFGIACLFRSTPERPLTMEWTRAGTGAITAARLSGAVPSDCGIETAFSNRPTSFSPAVTITLI